MTDLFMDLDRSSPVPLYFQVSQQIERAISSGHLGPGARLDNEISLADQFGLSRPTMRRAIQELVDKGLLVRKRGVGTQVVHGQVTRPVELTSLFDDLLRGNQAPRTTLLVNEIVQAT
jgi:DNA-binding GntR family transcriptional regulator